MDTNVDNYPNEIWVEPNRNTPASMRIFVGTGFRPDPDLSLAKYVRADIVKVAGEIAQREIEALQAKIDYLMMQYCPEEMTEIQRREWESHQHPEPSGK